MEFMKLFALSLVRDLKCKMNLLTPKLAVLTLSVHYEPLNILPESVILILSATMLTSPPSDFAEPG